MYASSTLIKTFETIWKQVTLQLILLLVVTIVNGLVIFDSSTDLFPPFFVTSLGLD